MDIKVLNNSKDSIEVQIGSLTIAELLRAYLNKDSAVTFAAWKRMHPTEAPILKVETKGKTAKKAIDDAILVVTRELDKILKDFDKIK